MITKEQIRKFKNRIIPLFAEGTVKAHPSHSKKGKAFIVKQYDRAEKDLIKAVDVAKKDLKGKKKDTQEHTDAWLRLAWARDNLNTYRKDQRGKNPFSWYRGAEK